MWVLSQATAPPSPSPLPLHGTKCLDTFYDFSWIWMKQQSDRLSVHRKFLGMPSNAQNYSKTGEILRSRWLMQPNVFLQFYLQKQSFRPRRTGRKCLYIIPIMTNNLKCLPKSEILISPELWQMTSKFQRQIRDCWPWQVSPSDCYNDW